MSHLESTYFALTKCGSFMLAALADGNGKSPSPPGLPDDRILAFSVPFLSHCRGHDTKEEDMSGWQFNWVASEPSLGQGDGASRRSQRPRVSGRGTEVGKQRVLTWLVL